MLAVDLPRHLGGIHRSGIDGVADQEERADIFPIDKTRKIKRWSGTKESSMKGKITEKSIKGKVNDGDGNGYLSWEQLANLKKYRYQSVDKSYVSRYILSIYWEQCVSLVPRWMAPNLITLLGFVASGAGLFGTVALSPDLAQPGPSILYYGLGLSMWLYSTLDNVDGRQARRTKSSTPLGEIFDHTIDSLQCTVVSFLLAANFNLGISTRTLVLNNILMTQFFATTWETYYTHKLYLDYINGPTEGIILSCAGFVISGIYTPEIWKIQLRQLIPWITTSSVVGQLDIADAVLIALAFFIVILGIPSSVIRSKRSIDEEKKSGYGPASVHMLEFCIFLGVEWLWYLIPNTIVTQSMTNFILFISSFGFLFSKIALDIIVAHVTSVNYPSCLPHISAPLCLSTLVYIAQYLSGNVGNIVEKVCLIVFFLFSLFAYCSSLWGVSRALCKHLNIRMFKIAHNKLKP